MFRLFLILLLGAVTACKNSAEMKFVGDKNEVKLITVNPGHFHASLVQKEMYEQVDPKLHIYAPNGSDLELHLQRINGFNSRENSPTSWQSVVYKGEDYFQRMVDERKGNVVILAGNNQKKSNYIKRSLEEGFNVLSDKPMAIDKNSFEMLEEAFRIAEKNNVLLYDIMTERYEITSQLQREIAMIPEIFGKLINGTPEEPAIVKESVHYFFKYVAGSVLRRPPWYFDVSQQGEGIVDVTTHLVDLIQWVSFPDKILDYKKDINVYAARRWPTEVTRQQFLEVTGLNEVPEYIENNIDDNVMHVFANGEMAYQLKGVHARVSVIWDYQAPEGGSDTHYSLMRGSKSNLIIRQGSDEDFIPMLFVEPAEGEDQNAWGKFITASFKEIVVKFPGVELVPIEKGFRIEIPDQYRIGHEAHFAQVTKKYLQFLVDGNLPKWEVPNMLAKYYTTTRALELARENTQSVIAH